MDINSKDYHDFVFQNGQLIGEFEQMYQKSEEVPWHQDKSPDTWHGRIATNVIEAAFEMGEVKSVLEVGVGFGNILAKLARPGVQFKGLDISPTAIGKAKALHPQFEFFVDDIRNLKHQGSYDLVICREVLWYVFPFLDEVISNLTKLTNEKKFLYISLGFPRLEKNFIGREVIPNPERLSSILSRDFEGIIYNTLYKLQFREDGPNFHWLGIKK